MVTWRLGKEPGEKHPQANEKDKKLMKETVSTAAKEEDGNAEMKG